MSAVDRLKGEARLKERKTKIKIRRDKETKKKYRRWKRSQNKIESEDDKNRKKYILVLWKEEEMEKVYLEEKITIGKIYWLWKEKKKKGKWRQKKI